jgi:RecA/RadA recombinase
MKISTHIRKKIQLAKKAKEAATGGMSLRERILKTSTIKETSILEDSKFFQPKDFITTPVPMLNVAMSGDPDGGMIPGVLMIAGPSRHFKTGFALLLAKAYLDKYEDAIILFYDSEFGSPQSYFTAHGIALDRVIHTPIQDVEQMKHDMMTQLKELTDADHVMIIADSIGNLASAKEIEDALKGDTKADFTRAKALKSLFRMITPHLTMKGIPFIAINHSYKTIEMYSKDQVGGGTGGIYAANDIWILGRQQDAEEGADKKKVLNGYNFVVNIEKSRFVKEKTKIIISVSFEDGIDRWSGLWDQARAFNIIVPANKRKNKKDAFVMDGTDPDDEENSFNRDSVESLGAFWKAVFKDTELKTLIKNKYTLALGDSIIKDEVDETMDLETGELQENA